MISHIRPEKFKVLSLTTIASPHRGLAHHSLSFAFLLTVYQAHLWRTMYLIKLEVRHYLLAYWDDLEDNIDFCAADRLPQIYYALNRLNVETGAFSQLTRKYMTETFNPNTPDVDDVRYVPDILPTLRPANIPQIFLLWSSSRAKYMVCLSAFTPSTCGYWGTQWWPS